MYKLIAIVDNISIVDNKKLIIKSTDNRYFLLKIKYKRFHWNPTIESIIQEFNDQEKIIWAKNNDLLEYKISSKKKSGLGEDILFSYDNETIKIIKQEEALTLLLIPAENKDE